MSVLGQVEPIEKQHASKLNYMKVFLDEYVSTILGKNI